MPQVEKKTNQVKEGTYSILLPPVRQCMKLVNRVSFLVTPLLPSLRRISATGGMADFSQLLQNTDPEKLDCLLMDAVKFSKLTFDDTFLGCGDGFDKHFGEKENKKNLYLILFWVLWECVQDFFPDWIAFVQEFKKKAAEHIQTTPRKKDMSHKPSQKVG